jgi:hypothetical protein
MPSVIAAPAVVRPEKSGHKVFTTVTHRPAPGGHVAVMSPGQMTRANHFRYAVANGSVPSPNAVNR